MCREHCLRLFFTVLSVGFPYFANVVQLLCSLSGWLHPNCSSICTGFNGAEINCRIARNLGILLMNSICFAIYSQQHSSHVCSDIYSLTHRRTSTFKKKISKNVLLRMTVRDGLQTLKAPKETSCNKPCPVQLCYMRLS